MGDVIEDWPLSDVRLPSPQDYSWAGAVDGMAGPEAYAILAPRGWWPPNQNPLLVREVTVNPSDSPCSRLTLTFKSF